MKSTWKKYLLYTTYTLLASGLLYGLLQLILSGYAVTWTGFQTKTLWDWMDLLIIPIVLALGAFFLNRSERAVDRENVNKRAELERQIAEERRIEDRKLAEERATLERDIAKDRQQETVLQTYLDRMSDLLLEKKLQNQESENDVRRFAKIRTVTILRILDLERKNLVIGFLRDANLATGKNSIFNSIDDVERLNLSKVNLRRVSFQMANLHKVNLQGAHLHGANLSMADLTEANLERARLYKSVIEDADLVGANLHKAFLYKANLKGSSLQASNLRAANFRGANLIDANLKDANLEGADLKGAIVTPEQLAQAKSLKGATMPDGTVHE